MPYRAHHLLLGLLGAAVVLTLLLWRASPERHATTGPRWKQRLINAGLLLLAAFGFGLGGGCREDKDPSRSGWSGQTEVEKERRRRRQLRAERLAGRKPVPPPRVTPRPRVVKPPDRAAAAGLHQERSFPDPFRPDPARKDAESAAEELRNQAPQKLILRTHDEAATIASGARGRYPFDKAGKYRVLAELSQAQLACDDLRKAGRLSEPGAALMKKRLARLHQQVNGFRYQGYLATCYRPGHRPSPKAQSFKRLTARLPLLEKLAASGKLNGAVVTKVLDAVLADVRVLEQPDPKRHDSLAVLLGEKKRPKEDPKRTAEAKARKALAKKVRRLVKRLSRRVRRHR